MAKKLNGQEMTQALSCMKVVSLSLLLSLLFADCNNADKVTKEEKKDSVLHKAPPGETVVLVDWLKDWDTVYFKVDPADSLKLDEEMKKTRAYVRGWLVEYNDSVKAERNGERYDYVVDKFEFNLLSRSPLAYKVRAFLNPPARTGEHDGPHSHEEQEEDPDDAQGVGGHLIPPPPPPPGKDG